MDTFCIIFKHAGDGVLALVGIFVSFIFISPAFTDWFTKKEAAVKVNKPLRTGLGIVLLLFCSVYILVTIWDGMNEAYERSPLHQAKMVAQANAYSRQMELKEHVTNFSSNLDAFASKFDPNNANNINQAEELQLVWFPQIDEWVRKLNDEGILSTNLPSLFDELHKRAINDPKNAKTLKDIVRELKSMTKSLPKTLDN